MKTLCEFGVIENKPSVEKISYFFIDNFNIVYSQPHIPRTMATPVFGKKNTCAEIQSPTVEDEIDSFWIVEWW